MKSLFTPSLVRVSSSPCPQKFEQRYSSIWHKQPACGLLSRSSSLVCLGPVGTLMAPATSSRAEMGIPVGCLSMWTCCYAVCCPWRHEYLAEMASMNGISTDICAYLPFEHDWTKRTTQGKLHSRVTSLHHDPDAGLSSVWTSNKQQILTFLYWQGTKTETKGTKKATQLQNVKIKQRQY